MNWIVIALAALCLGLNIFSAVTKVELRELRSEYQERQAYLAEDAGYRRLNTELVKALANLAASTGDQDIHQMLSTEGISYTVNTPPAPAPVPAEEVSEEGGND